VARIVPLSMSCSDPEGCAPDCDVALTMAANVTCCPSAGELGDAVSAVVVEIFAAEVTVCDKAVDALAVRLASPPYKAGMLWVPAASPAVLNDAVPDVSIEAEPSWVAWSRNWTEPEALVDPTPVTLAVKVTTCPACDGLSEELSDTLLAALLTFRVI